MPSLGQEDFLRGAAVLSLIEDWSAWVHRRVEHVTLGEPQVSERRVSFDFALPPTFAETRVGSNGTDPAYLVPVTWITKHRITKFSLRDESDRALAALTQTQTSAIATTVLAVAAQEGVPDKLSQIPPDLLDDFWTISTAKRGQALAVWAKLRLLPREIPDPQAREESIRWREALVGNDEFMALANDVARNFLIVTQLDGKPGARRIIKLSYEEQRLSTPLRQKGDGHVMPSVEQKSKAHGRGWLHDETTGVAS
jgi:hypothetical protein